MSRTNNKKQLYDVLVDHLKSKQFPAINNKILNANKLDNVIFREPVPYVLNKLNNLYNITDGELVTKELLSGIKGASQFKSMVEHTDRFKADGLAKVVNKSLEDNNINWCVMHGNHTEKLFTVPDNVILVFMAPTNRVLIQDQDNYKEFESLVKDDSFVRAYTKRPSCLYSHNYCFKYTTILYPGQKTFDLEFKGPFEHDVMKDYMGFFSKTDNYIHHPPESYAALSEYIKPGGIYFIYSCRGCNMTLPPKLVEVLYYNEYVCNFINKRGNICARKNNKSNNITKKQLCNVKLFSKSHLMQNKSTPNLNFSPINNKNNKSNQLAFDFVTELKDIRVNKTHLDPFIFEQLFNIMYKMAERGNFFDYINTVVSLINKGETDLDYIRYIYYYLFSKDLLYSWLEFIDTSFFIDDETFKYNLNIELIFKKQLNDINLFIRLLLGQLIYYYFYTKNKTRRETLETVFGYIINIVGFKMFTIIPMAVNTKTGDFSVIGDAFPIKRIFVNEDLFFDEKNYETVQRKLVKLE